MPNYKIRLQRLQQQLTDAQAMLLADPAALGYLTGFRILTTNEREGYLLITSSQVVLFAAAFSPLPSYLELEQFPDGFQVQRTLQLLAVCSVLAKQKVSELFLDENFLTINEFHSISEHAQQVGNPLSLRTFDRQLLWASRMIKDTNEIDSIKKAGQIAAQAMDELLDQLTVGQTEQEIALTLDHRFRQLGAECPAFPTIIAFGKHAALPHYQPGDTRLEPETAVLIDCGARVDGYNSDMTRTVWFGNQPSTVFTQVKTVVDRAYTTGRSLVSLRMAAQQPVSARELDLEVRREIEEAGFGQQFIHTTGHGLGWEIHEPPSIYQTNGQQLLSQMIITIEPGIYIPNQLGYRNEDSFLITSQGLEVLTEWTHA